MLSLMKAVGELGLRAFDALVRDFKASAVVGEFQHVSQGVILLWVVNEGFQRRLARRLVTLPEPFPDSAASLDRFREFARRGTE